MSGQHRKSFSARLTGGLMHLARPNGVVAQPERHSRRPAAPAADTAPLPPVPAAAIRRPVVPDTVADIDPARQPAELPARTTSQARAAVAALHTDYPGIPAGAVRWTYLDDGAHGVVSQNPDVSDEDRRSVIATYAAAFAAQPAARARDDGFVICSAAGEHPAFPGTRIAVEATCCPAVEERLAVFEAAVADLQANKAKAAQAGSPATSPVAPAATPARRSLPAAGVRLALPAPREAT